MNICMQKENFCFIKEMANDGMYCEREIDNRKIERERGGGAGVRWTRAGFRKVEHSFGDNERICNHDYIVQDPAVS